MTRVISKHLTALERQVRESVNIKKCTQDNRDRDSQDNEVREGESQGERRE